MKKDPISSKSQTDWERIDDMTDEDLNLCDCPEITPQMFAASVVRHGLKPVPKKVQVTLRLDSDITSRSATPFFQ